MGQTSHNFTRLPRQLLEELGGSSGEAGHRRKKRAGQTGRKEQRKAARAQKKSSHVPRNRNRPLIQVDRLNGEDERPESSVRAQRSSVLATSSQSRAIKPISKIPRSTTQANATGTSLHSPYPCASPPRQTKIARDRLAADDAEISALEKALGVKGKKKLPKWFEDDGLDSLLEDIDEVGLSEKPLGKRNRSEGEQWLDNKRQKVQPTASQNGGLDTGEDSDLNSRVFGSELQQSSGESSDIESGTNVDELDTLDIADELDQPLTIELEKSPRENPYVAPKTSVPIKYIPLSLRSRDITDPEDFPRLRRKLQGLLNRLSEANITSILGDVEQIYRDHPRQHVSTTLLDLLIGLLSDPTILSDTFIILHAAFIAAVFKVIGTDFGAQAILRIDEEFEQTYSAKSSKESIGKKLTNLVSLLSMLYNFQVVGSSLIYDHVRLFLKDLSDLTTELLLKIIRNAGPQLRQDDPSSLKDIILQLQSSVAKVGEENLPVRTKFMIETINQLKNNRIKTGSVATTISSEHTLRMKRTLGTLNARNLKANEPLRIGMKDLRDKDKVGAWWLVGASYKGQIREVDDANEPSKYSRVNEPQRNEEAPNTTSGDLVHLAKDQRMNTDVRRSIFVAIMSSSDYNDAYVRLMKLRLKRSQKLEIPKVLIHCAGAEKLYNPFYAFLSRRICSDKKLKMSFQFCLWDLFKQMGEGDETHDSDQEDEGEEKLRLRSLVNLAKMFGVLVAEDGLGLGVFKNLNLAYLHLKTQTFLEVLIITAIFRCQQDSHGSRNEKALLTLFLKPKEMPDMASGLHYFLKKVVRKSDVVGSRSERETVEWACRTACDALATLGTKTVVNE